MNTHLKPLLGQDNLWYSDFLEPDINKHFVTLLFKQVECFKEQK